MGNSETLMICYFSVMDRWVGNITLECSLEYKALFTEDTAFSVFSVKTEFISFSEMD